MLLQIVVMLLVNNETLKINMLMVMMMLMMMMVVMMMMLMTMMMIMNVIMHYHANTARMRRHAMEHQYQTK